MEIRVPLKLEVHRLHASVLDYCIACQEGYLWENVVIVLIADHLRNVTAKSVHAYKENGALVYIIRFV